MKKCYGCQVNKSLSSYHRNRNRPDGRHTVCKVCRSLRGAEYKRKERYGMAPGEYIELLRGQNFKCPICLEVLQEESGHIDHCHDTNRVRGILCRACNLGLGHLKDGRDLTIFERCRAYCDEP